jgi:hypothetical protein
MQEDQEVSMRTRSAGITALVAVLFLPLLSLSGCDDDRDPRIVASPHPNPESKIYPSPVPLAPGEEVRLEARMSPNPEPHVLTPFEVVWSSSDESAALHLGEGRIKVDEEGEVFVRASTRGGPRIRG